MRILEVEGLSAWYTQGKTRRPVLRDVTFHLDRGEVLGLVGESGSGKSTLARSILGLHRDWEGRVRHYTPRPQMIFQDPYRSLNPAHTLLWTLTEPLRAAGVPEARRRERAMALLDRVGLAPELARRYPQELSGGQRQRVAIAAAVIARPGLVVADEPVSALDVTVQRQILELLMDLKREYGFSCLFISHDLGVIYQICDRVLVMEGGRIVEENDTDALFAAPKHPFTKELLEAAE